MFWVAATRWVACSMSIVHRTSYKMYVMCCRLYEVPCEAAVCAREMRGMAGLPIKVTRYVRDDCIPAPSACTGPLHPPYYCTPAQFRTAKASCGNYLGDTKQQGSCALWSSTGNWRNRRENLWNYLTVKAEFAERNSHLLSNRRGNRRGYNNSESQMKGQNYSSIFHMTRRTQFTTQNNACIDRRPQRRHCMFCLIHSIWCITRVKCD